MHAFSLSEEITLHMIFTTLEHHVCSLWIDVEVPIFAAYRAVAVGDFLPF